MVRDDESERAPAGFDAGTNVSINLTGIIITVRDSEHCAHNYYTHDEDENGGGTDSFRPPPRSYP